MREALKRKNREQGPRLREFAFQWGGNSNVNSVRDRDRLGRRRSRHQGPVCAFSGSAPGQWIVSGTWMRSGERLRAMGRSSGWERGVSFGLSMEGWVCSTCYRAEWVPRWEDAKELVRTVSSWVLTDMLPFL